MAIFWFCAVLGVTETQPKSRLFQTFSSPLICLDAGRGGSSGSSQRAQGGPQAESQSSTDCEATESIQATNFMLEQNKTKQEKDGFSGCLLEAMGDLKQTAARVHPCWHLLCLWCACFPCVCPASLRHKKNWWLAGAKEESASVFLCAGALLRQRVTQSLLFAGFH